MNFELSGELNFTTSIFVTLTPNSKNSMYWPWFGLINLDYAELSLGRITVNLHDPNCLNELEANLPYFRGEVEKRVKYEPFH